MKNPVGLVLASVGYTLLTAAFCVGAPAQPDAPSASCTGLCLQQVICPNPAVTTTVTGTVLAPNGVDPVYNAMVYVPNGAAGAPTYGVTPFTPGVHCGQCGSEVSGSPLVSTLTAVNGTFTLRNMPVGTNIPLVIQIGRWRRRITIANVPSCVTTAVSTGLTRLPRNKTEGDIPLMAFSTGSVDALECVLRKIGIQDSEFTSPTGTGRVHLYVGEGAGGAQAPGTPISATVLFGTQAQLNKYDMVFFPCQGAAYLKTAAEQQRVIDYVNAGGRVFATHYSYIWLFNVVPFSGTAAWQVDQVDPNLTDPAIGYVNTSFPRGLALAQWLQLVGASTTLAQIQLDTLRIDFNGVVPPALHWISLGAPPTGAFTHPMQYSFDTPVGAPPASQCGRVFFNDYHVEDAFASGLTFPAECTGGVMTAQEKLLEFNIFDLGSCLGVSAQINAISHTASGHAILVGKGNPSYPATIQFSPDLVTPFNTQWIANTDDSGNFSFDDAFAFTASKRFYRVMPPGP
jgi:hypothetical protein